MEEKMENNIETLVQIYKIHDDYISALELKCKRRCADCCTRNVTLTSLEGYLLKQGFDDMYKEAVEKKLTLEATKKRFQPGLTTNGLADLCASGGDIPKEEVNPDWGKCPLLVNDECSIYEHRPFECRSMVSTTVCREMGYSKMDEYTITVNNVIKQYIEHVDQNGVTGNLTDMMLWMNNNDDGTIVKNRPVSYLLIPPEHMNQIEPILRALHDLGIK